MVKAYDGNTEIQTVSVDSYDGAANISYVWGNRSRL